MSTRIEVETEIAERLLTLAKDRGISVDALLHDLLSQSGQEQESGETSLAEFEDDLDALVADLEHLSVQYQGTYSRSDIYLDHD